jgi:hypothetical protein
MIPFGCGGKHNIHAAVIWSKQPAKVDPHDKCTLLIVGHPPKEQVKLSIAPR